MWHGKALLTQKAWVQFHSSTANSPYLIVLRPYYVWGIGILDGWAVRKDKIRVVVAVRRNEFLKLPVPAPTYSSLPTIDVWFRRGTHEFLSQRVLDYFIVSRC